MPSCKLPLQVVSIRSGATSALSVQVSPVQRLSTIHTFTLIADPSMPKIVATVATGIGSLAAVVMSASKIFTSAPLLVTRK